MPVLPLYPSPPDATVLCDNPAARNPAEELDPARRELRRRFTGILLRRWRRVARLLLGVSAVTHWRGGGRSIPRRLDVYPLRHRRPARWRAPRPRPGRALCAESGRCRMHLAEFFYAGDAPMREACALVVAWRGGLSQDEVGALTGMSRQAVQQIEQRAYGLKRMRALAADGPPRDVAALEARVVGALERSGERSLAELTRLVRASDERVLEVLHGMQTRGEVANRKAGHMQARVWTLTRNVVDMPASPQ